MSFMHAEMTAKQEWVEMDTSHGTFYVPNVYVGLDAKDCRAINDSDESPSCLKDYLKPGSRLDEVKIVFGYGVRSSARGYMDCTDWSVYTNKREAQQAARQEQRECDGEE